MFRRSIIVAGALIALAAGAAAESGDAAYCGKLSSAYREYARSGQIDESAALAMGQCNKVKLPSRT